MAAQPVHLERKVIAGSVLTLLASGAVAVLNGLNGSALLGSLPPYAQSLLVLVVPALVTFLGQYATPHTTRDDLAEEPDPEAGAITVFDAVLVLGGVFIVLAILAITGVINAHPL